MSDSNKDQESILHKISSAIRKEVDDLSYVEVITASAKDMLINIDAGEPDITKALAGKEMQVRVLARTRIELDGDISMLIPGDVNGDVTQLNKDVMDIHKENVAMAVQNWQTFLNTMITAVKDIVVIFNDNAKTSKLLEDLQITPKPPS